MSGALDGIRVVELGIWVAVPAACALLAEHGAEVVKIELLEGGDPARGMMTVSPFPMEGWNYFFELHNRNKKSIGLDLRDRQAREIAYELIRRSDVFATNFRKDALHGLGMAPQRLRELNPKLIFAYCSAYGQFGSERDERGFDHGAFWARSGMMATSGEPDGPPPLQRPAMGDRTVAAVLAGAILMGLLARERLGVAQDVDVSLLGCGVFVGGLDLQSSLAAHRDIPAVSRKDANNPLYNAYRTGDDKWIHLILVQGERWWPQLCKAINRPDLAEDPRFNTQKGLMQNNRLLITMLDEIIGGRSQAEWTERFREEGLIWAQVSTPAEVVADPQVLENNYIVEVDHPEFGRIREVASPIQLSRQAPSINTCAPELGQHTEEIMLDLGYSWEDIIKLKEAKAAI